MLYKNMYVYKKQESQIIIIYKTRDWVQDDHTHYPLLRTGPKPIKRFMYEESVYMYMSKFRTIQYGKPNRTEIDNIVWFCYIPYKWI